MLGRAKEVNLLITSGPTLSLFFVLLVQSERKWRELKLWILVSYYRRLRANHTYCGRKKSPNLGRLCLVAQAVGVKKTAVVGTASASKLEALLAVLNHASARYEKRNNSRTSSTPLICFLTH